MKLLFSFITCTLFSLPLLAQDISISTGGRGGSYFTTGENLSKVLAEYEYTATTAISQGSVENIERVVGGEATLGFTQLDALAWWMARNPDNKDDLKVLGDLYPECVYIAVNRRGPIGNEGDLQSDAANVAVQKRGSGSAVSWSYIQQLEPKFARGATYYQGGLQLLNEIANNRDHEINAFMWVSNPDNLEHRFLRTVQENKELELIDIDDWDLNDKHPELGRSIYRFEKPDVAKGFLFDTELETICVDAVVIASVSADDTFVDDVVEILTLNRNRLF